MATEEWGDSKPVAQKSVELARLELDRANVLTQTRAQILNEGTKILLLINGGGAAALAALLQAVWDKPTATPMLWWILVGISSLIFGAGLATLIPLTRYMGSLHRKTTRPRKNPWWWAGLAVSVLSLICFLTGMALAVVGGFRAL